MKNLRSNIRFYILLFSVLLSLNIFLVTVLTIPSETVQIIRMNQIFGLLAVLFLYLTLLAGPLCFTFRKLPFCKQYLKSRRALGVSVFYFSLLHVLISFFGQLGGFSGLGFLSNNYLLSLSIGFIALIVFFALAVTSFDKVVAKMTFPRWKILHRLVYVAGVFTLIHAVMLGTHFQELYTFIPQALFAALAFLIFLELLRFDALMKKRFPNTSQVYPLAVPLYGLLGLGILYFLIPLPSTEDVSFGIHAEHIRLAKEAQQGFSPNGTTPFDITSSVPGLDGDRTKRYTVSFDHPENINPNEEVPLTFTVYDASSGKEVELFNRLYEKIVHMIVVDNTLTYFNHIHPEQEGSSFTITTSFPTNGRYHIYLDFQPFGAIEQQMAFNVNVGNTENLAEPTHTVDDTLTKTFGEYKVELDFPKPLKASAMSIGQQEMSFTIRDATSGEAITTLKPYLAAFGHLVLINQETFDYVHVHPSALRPPRPNENGGPTVKFLPLGLYGPIKPGIYRVFAQFNPDNNLFTSDFTIKVK